MSYGRIKKSPNIVR